MMETGDLLFENGCARIQTGAITIKMFALEKKPGQPFDVRLSALGSELLVEDFALPMPDTEVDGRRPSFVPYLAYANLPGRAGALVLAGNVDAIVARRSGSLTFDVLPLFRDSLRDTGFDNLKFIEIPSGSSLSGAILTYERGVALILADGRIAWHVELTWNDAFIRVTNSSIVYFSDFAEVGGRVFEGEFGVRLSDGMKILIP